MSARLVCYLRLRRCLMTAGVAVEQWKSEFKRWCDIDERIITKFTSGSRELPNENGIVICTFACDCWFTNCDADQILNVVVLWQAISRSSAHDGLH